jgi:hypothetical protein
LVKFTLWAQSSHLCEMMLSCNRLSMWVNCHLHI